MKPKIINIFKKPTKYPNGNSCPENFIEIEANGKISISARGNKVGEKKHLQAFAIKMQSSAKLEHF